MFEVVRAVRDAVVSEPSRFAANGTDLHRRNDASGRNRIGMIFEFGQFHRRKYNAIPTANFSCLIQTNRYWDEHSRFPATNRCVSTLQDMPAIFVFKVSQLPRDA
jgi:hypothetical protein